MKIPDFIKKNLLLKVISANALLVFVRMGLSFISQKVLAIFLGAEGIALVGNLRNVYSFFEQFSIFGVSNGLVKFISEFRDDREQLNKLFSSTFLFSLFASIISFGTLFFGSDLLNELIFGIGNNYEFAFKVLAFMLPFMGLNSVLNALLNGLTSYRRYAQAGMLTALLSTIFIIIFVISNGISGAFFAIIFIPIIQYLCYHLLTYKFYRGYINFKALRLGSSLNNKLLSYSFMTVVVVLAINVSEVAIRRLIETHENTSESGYWTAMNFISRAYMQFFLAIFPLYILPKYAKITNTFDFRIEVKNVYKNLLPILLLGMILCFLFRDYVIRLLYTEDFLSMSELFLWQLLGDFVKFLALVISYQFLAKKQVGRFVFTELFSVLMFYVLSVYFIKDYGTVGVVIAHFVRYVLYFLVVLFILRNSFVGESKQL